MHNLRFPAVLGFCVKSGWSAVVLLAGPVRSPSVLDKAIIELCDPLAPETRQPYHAGSGTLESDEAKVTRRVQMVRACAHETITKLLLNYRYMECGLSNAALAVGSVVDPANITNPHIRAHALEGQLFRVVLEEILTAAGLRCSILVQRRALEEAAVVLELNEPDLNRKLSDLGRGQTRPWRAEQKMAALAAWAALARA